MKTLLFHCLIVALTVASDQAIKTLADSTLPFQQMVPLLPFLALFRTYNTGVAFSMFDTSESLWLIIMSVLVVGFVLFLAWKTEANQRIARFGFALVVGGALGNLLDRGIHGYVIDYIYFHTPVWSFAIFNMADVFISIGAGLVLLEEALAWRRERAAKAAADR
ncbi:MAG: signal peptidase II [Methylobacterium mesophilicum]|nr:signal peptidase II [Methylobacterium mesophilicum]